MLFLPLYHLSKTPLIQRVKFYLYFSIKVRCNNCVFRTVIYSCIVIMWYSCKTVTKYEYCWCLLFRYLLTNYSVNFRRQSTWCFICGKCWIYQSNYLLINNLSFCYHIEQKNHKFTPTADNKRHFQSVNLTSDN